MFMVPKNVATWKPSMWNLLIPEIVAALASSLVTSYLCGTWRIGDVASALYFAPLLFPVAVMTVIFSVQWISVCVGSCTNVPVRWILAFIAVVVFIKIPVNLIGGLLFAALFKRIQKPKPAHASVVVRRLTRSRTNFFTVVHSWLFIVAFPILYECLQSLDYPLIVRSSSVPWVYIAIWVMTSISTGIGSLAVRFETDADWGIFSFLSSGGSGLMLWVMLNVWLMFVDGQDSTLQTSLAPTATGLVCGAMAMASGSVSVLAAVIWIERKGTQLRART
jgi:hypothetical protein